MRQEDFEDVCERFIKDLMKYHYGELTREALYGVMDEVYGVVDAVKIGILQDLEEGKHDNKTSTRDYM